MKIANYEVNGQAQCELCSDRGICNAKRCCFMFEIKGYEGLYCSKRINEIKIKPHIIKKHKTTCN